MKQRSVLKVESVSEGVSGTVSEVGVSPKAGLDSHGTPMALF